MTLLDDARRLAAQDAVAPYPDEDVWRCMTCMAETAWIDGAVPERFDHESDCAGLSMPKIVAALEAAEQLIVTAWERPADTLDGRYLVDANEISALETALQSVRVVTRVIAP